MLVALNEEKGNYCIEKDAIFLSDVWEASYFKAWAQSN